MHVHIGDIMYLKFLDVVSEFVLLFWRDGHLQNVLNVMHDSYEWHILIWVGAGIWHCKSLTFIVVKIKKGLHVLVLFF